MWKCEWCGEQFEKPKWVKDGFVTKAVCPSCHEEDITDISDWDTCECCGKKVEETNKQGVCEDCREALAGIWEEAILAVMDLTDMDYVDSREFFIGWINDVRGE